MDLVVYDIPYVYIIMYENLHVTVLTIFYLYEKCVSYVYMYIIEHILREIVN